MHRYFSRRQDICCEENINRQVVIQHLFELYVGISGNENKAMDEMHEDFLKFVGYKANDKKNYQGMRLHKQMNNETRKKGELDREAFIEALKEVPLYYLLSFLGYAYYRNKQDVVPPSNPSVEETMPPEDEPLPPLSSTVMDPLPPLRV